MWRSAWFPYLTGWTIIIIALSTSPPETLPSFSWDQAISLDKLGHLVFYSILCIICCMTLMGWERISSKNTTLWISFMYCVVLGFLLELAQLFMHVGRSFDILDLIANIIGATIGAVAFVVFIKFKR